MMLDLASRRAITNLALQKLLYFAHGLYLVETGKPLVAGYFEAWRFGPVHPAAYRAYKAAGDRPITFRAEREEPLSGTRSPIPPPDDPEIIDKISRAINLYAGLTPGRLVEISHAPKAPWRYVVDKARTSVAFGLRIPDDVILDRFKFHKVSIGLVPAKGEPGEDAPFDT